LEVRPVVIPLTPEQAEAIPFEGEPVRVSDPRTNRLFRLIPEEVYQRLKMIPYDDSPWTADETAVLAGQAFGKLDDTDYTEYLRDEA
jgi:hypothetical protein